MKYRAIAQNLGPTTRVVRRDIEDYLRARLRPLAVRLSETQQEHLARLRVDGFAVIDGYWPRDRALAMRDKLQNYLSEERDKDFTEGAYLRFWDKRGYDHGVRRLYHVDKVVPELAGYRNDPFILDIVSAYYNHTYHSGVLVFQHNTADNDDTRGWHVDMFTKEFKSFIYLDDVDENNGPFTYLAGTQRSHFTRLKKQLMGNVNDSETSFYERDLQPLLGKERKITGPAGTLILADVRGFHKGSPQRGRSRSVLVNYMYSAPGDKLIDK